VEPEVPAARQIAQVLAYLAGHSDSVRLMDVVAATGLHKSRCLALLRSLVGIGYVLMDPATKRYRLGPALIRLGFTALRSQEILAVARPEMRALSTETGLVCAAAQELADGSRVTVVTVEPPSIRVTISVGPGAPPGTGAPGKAFLAWRTRDEVEVVLARWGLPALTARSITEPAAYFAELDRVRAAGYATSEGEMFEQVNTVAAPVFGPDGTVALVITLYGFEYQLPHPALPAVGERVRAAAARITTALGGIPPQVAARPPEAWPSISSPDDLELVPIDARRRVSHPDPC
jgi:IclR family acetate operon transcriptional repressor